MTYFAGQRITLPTVIRDLSGTPADATVVLTLTRPDGTTSTPAVDHGGTGQYSADVTFDQPGDWLVVWTASGPVVSVDTDQVHVTAPALRAVGLTEVKEHGNITATNADRELLDFIGTAQEMVEAAVGATAPRTITGEILLRRRGETLTWLRHTPVLAVLAVVEGGQTLTPGTDYLVWPDTGQLDRLGGRRWAGDVLVDYRAGRNPIPDAIRWGVKELTIHLWRSTQAQRGGRARGDVADAAVVAGFGVPNRVRDALQPYLLAPLVA